MKKLAAVIAVTLALVMVGSGQWPFPNSGSTYSGIPSSVTIGIVPGEAYELIYIAEDQGYFAENDLNVAMRNYETTPKAIDGLLNGDVDMAFTGEYTAVAKAFENKNFSIIACIDKSKSVYLYGRKDRGIENVPDLKGKKIGLTRGCQVEFFLGRFLDLHGMSLQDVTVVNLQPSQYVDAIATGNVDSMVAADSFVDQCKERLGRNLIQWPIQSSQKAFNVMACRSNWTTSHPEQINRFLKSLGQAEEYTINHPAEAKAILQKRLNYTNTHIETIWPNHEYSLSLDQSILIAMNDEALWMIRNNLTNERTLPDFSKYIYVQGLRKVKPDAVNIR